MEPQLHLYIAVFLESLSREAMQAAERLSDGRPFVLTPHSLLVRTSISDPKVIRDVLGMGEHSPGTVFKLTGSYSGYHHADLSEWLREAREQKVYG